MNKIILFMFFFCLMIASITVASPVSSSPLIGDSWNSMSPMHQARGGLGVVSSDGKIYAIGGSTASGAYSPDISAGGFVGTNEEYDPTTDTWTTKASMPTPRDYFAIAAYQNKIYCIGGAVGFSFDERSGFYSYITTSVNEVYDTSTDHWETKASMPFNGMKLQANVVDGKVYVLQGSHLYEYDPDNDSWTSKPSIPATLRQESGSPPATAIVDGEIIVTGEFKSTFLNFEQKIIVYNPKTESWTEGKTGSQIVINGGATATTGIDAPSKVYVLGLSYGTFPAPSTNQVYDPETDTWMTAKAMPTLLIDFGLAVLDDVLYVIGGYTYTSRIYGTVTPVAVNEQYVPIDYRTTPTVKILEPVNQVYNGSSVSLVFSVDKLVQQTYYSLDKLDNETLAGNITLSGLSVGVHNVTVYAQDFHGSIGTSETITFNIATESPAIAPVAATTGLIAVVIVVGLFFYFRKRSH